MGQERKKRTGAMHWVWFYVKVLKIDGAWWVEGGWSEGRVGWIILIWRMSTKKWGGYELRQRKVSFRGAWSRKWVEEIWGMAGRRAQQELCVGLGWVWW